MAIMQFNSRAEDRYNDQEDEPHGGKKSSQAPQYVIGCKQIFDSTMKDFEDFAPCDWVKTGGSRITSFDSSGKIKGDSKIIGKDPLIRMNSGPWSPIIQQLMYDGKVLDEIDIIRIQDIHGNNEPIQQLIFKHCFIKTYDQEAEKILFSFCYNILEDLSISYDSTGQKQGCVGMQFNFTTLQSKHISKI